MAEQKIGPSQSIKIQRKKNEVVYNQPWAAD
jgi:hypothetical protein